MIEILDPGPLATIQDLGRSGLAHLGVGRSGAGDRSALRRANRLVGNLSHAAVIEVTAGGLALRLHRHCLLACAGAPCRGAVPNGSVMLSPGDDLRLGPPTAGLRTYVAVRGGIDVEPVLGSRSTDLLAGIGPPVLRRGDVFDVGDEMADWPTIDIAPAAEPKPALTVRLAAGPRLQMFVRSWSNLARREYVVSHRSNRTALRLEGPPLAHNALVDFTSEGLLAGAVQIPNDGQPIVFLADHPVTGGYPVLGYVEDDDLDRVAQLRAGDTLRFARTIREIVLNRC